MKIAYHTFRFLVPSNCKKNNKLILSLESQMKCTEVYDSNDAKQSYVYLKIIASCFFMNDCYTQVNIAYIELNHICSSFIPVCLLGRCMLFQMDSFTSWADGMRTSTLSLGYFCSRAEQYTENIQKFLAVTDIIMPVSVNSV